MKLFKFGLFVLAVALAVSVGTAQASTFFFSSTSTSPAIGTNPSVTTTVGGTVTLYMFWEPTTTSEDGGNEQLSGWGHTIVDDNAILSTTTYTYLNPKAGGSYRWTTTGTGTAPTGTFLVGGTGLGAEAVHTGGSNLGFFPTTAQGYFAEGPYGVWRLSTLTVSATSAGTANIFMDVGIQGISFEASPNERNINVGFNDAAIASNAFNQGSTVADATIVVTAVPEPSTLALLGMGVVGLAVAARRRRNR